MSIVGGGIIGLTVGAVQTRFGFISDVGILRFAMLGALAGFGGSMVSYHFCNLQALVLWD